ncbi:MAG: hypothetical protein AB7S77_03120 [Desulfatirhabdiaceae bacterium]
MDIFQEIQLQYRQLLDHLQSGAISREFFDNEVAKLRVQDAQGTWWSILPATGSWCYWDGGAWVEATAHEAKGSPSAMPVSCMQTPGPDAFDQTAEQYRILLDQHNRGKLDTAVFDQAVAALRVTDGGGAVWQIVPQTGIWVRWDGQQWVETEPPLPTPDGRQAAEPSIYAEFDRHYQKVLERFRKGGISEQEFQDRIARLRVKDEQGIWWQILPDTGQWARWSGHDWNPAEPPRELVGAVGPVRKFAADVIDSTKAQVKETVRSIPQMIMWWLISRGIMMVISYVGALYLHAYLCGYMNNGIRDDGGIWAPWLYLTQSRQGALSAPMIWGVAGMILTSLVMTTIRRGPSGAIKSLVQMPLSFISMMKAGGRAGAGGLAMGAGAAIVMKYVLGINSQASYTLSLGMLLMGMGTAGRIIAGFFLGIVRRVIAPRVQRLTRAVEPRLPVDLRTLQLVFIGIAPGFLLAGHIANRAQLLTGLTLLILGFILTFNIQKPWPSTGSAAMFILYACFGSAIYAFLDFFFSREAFADDGGKDEFGGPPEKYWETEGKKLLDHSKTAADSSAVGAAAGADAGTDPEQLPPVYSFFLTIDESHMNLTSSISEDVYARVDVTGENAAECAALSDKLTASIQFAMSGNCTDWFTCGQVEAGGSMRGYFTLQIPDDAVKIPGPHLVAFTASVTTPKGVLSRACRITVSVAEGFELRMSESMTIQANASLSSLYCGIVCTDDSILNSKEMIDAAVPNIEFKVEGAQAHWIRESGGEAGVLKGIILPEGKETSFSADVPFENINETPPYGAAVTASVQIPKVGSLSQVCSLEITPPEWFIEARIVKNDLVLDFKDSADICARLIPMDESKLSLYGTFESNPLNSMLTVKGTGSNGPYAVFTEKNGEQPGFRTWSVSFSQNLPSDMKEVAPTMEIEISAVVTGQKLVQPITINLLGKPSLEVLEKKLGIPAGGDPVPVHVHLKDGGDLDWSLSVEIFRLDEVEPAGPPESEEKGKWTLSLRGSALAEGDHSARSGKLQLTAHTTDPKTGEKIETDPVEVDLTLAQVGLSVMPSPVKLALDPVKDRPSTFNVRVLKYNAETRVFEPDAGAMKDLEKEEWEDGEFEGGGNTFKGAEVELGFDHFEGSGSDLTAIWYVKQKIKIPASQVIDAFRVLRTPGDYGDLQDLFEVRQRFIAPVDPASQESAKIQKEQENCRKILDYLPEGSSARTKFSETIEKDAKTLGAEGLFHLRHEVWEAARKSLAEEAESYLENARVYETAEKVCDWVNYVCKLVVSGMSSVLVPFPGDMAVTVLMDAVPDLVNAVWGGKSAADWAKEFAYGFASGIPGMGVDIAVGQVINLEDMVYRAARESKSFKKGCLVGCIIYWEVRFVRYQITSKPDGEPFSLKESMVNALRDLAEEIITTGIGKGTKWAKDGHDAAFGHGYDAADGSVYADSGKPPDTSGMPDVNIESAKEIAKKNGVEIYVRPTNPNSKKLLEAGAHPKPETIKSKTINKEDTHLGCKKEDMGKVGYFDPGPNPPAKGELSDAEYKDVLERYKQRRQEFVDNKKDFEKLKHADDGVEIKDGVVVSKKDGKPYTGDHDVYDIRDKNGNPVDKDTYDKVIQDLRDSKFQAQHPGHRQWDYSNLDKKPGQPTKDVNGNPVAPQSKFEKAKAIDGKIIDSHQATTSSGKEGEALIKFGPDGKISGQHLKPPPTTYTKGGRATQSVSGTMRHDQNEKEKA